MDELLEPPGIHVKLVAPVAVNVAVLFEHIVAEGAAVMVAGGAN
jgi:hypothetical protein